MKDFSFSSFQPLLFLLSLGKREISSFLLWVKAIEWIWGVPSYNSSLDKNNCVIKILTQCYNPDTLPMASAGSSKIFHGNHFLKETKLSSSSSLG